MVIPFPVGLIVRGKPCLIVGGGESAPVRVDQLSQAGASVTLVHPRLSGRLKAQARKGLFRHRRRPLKAEDTWGMFMVFYTLTDPAVSKRLLRLSLRNGFLLNCHDQPDFSNFVMPAIVDRGPFKIAITSGGTSPGISKRLREDLDDIFDGKFTRFLNWVSTNREKIKQTPMPPERRMRRLRSMTRRFKLSGKIHYPSLD